MHLKSHTMRDLQEEPGDMSPMDKWVASLPEGSGRMDPYNPRHQKDIEGMMQAIASGQLNESSVEKLAKNNPKTAHLLYSAYGDWKATSDARMKMGQFFRNEVPERQVQDTYQPYGPTQEGPAMQPIDYTRTVPGQPAVNDVEGAVTYLNSIGMHKEADQLLKQRQSAEQKNMGIKMAMRAAGLDPNTPLENLTPEQAQSVYRYYSNPMQLAVPGGTHVVPRGSVGGFVPNPTPVPSKTLTEISDAATSLEKMRHLDSGFKDEYGGYGSDTLGNAAIEYKKRFGKESDTEMVDWWQSYQDHVNITRNKLFGSALTATEKTEFFKAMVTPGMRPEQIRKNLARQDKMAARAARKIARQTASNKGYNQDQIRESLGGLADELLSEREMSPPANSPGSSIRPRVKFSDLP